VEIARRFREHVSAKFSVDQTCRSYLRLAGYAPLDAGVELRASPESGVG